MFSTLDNAVTLVHAGGATDIGQWPRILLALSGLAAGFIFDIKNRKYMGIVMYCIMVLSTICVAILKFAGPFMAGLYSICQRDFLPCSLLPVLWKYPAI